MKIRNAFKANADERKAKSGDACFDKEGGEKSRNAAFLTCVAAILSDRKEDVKEIFNNF